jgi:hypothetical protein
MDLAAYQAFGSGASTITLARCINALPEVTIQ